MSHPAELFSPPLPCQPLMLTLVDFRRPWLALMPNWVCSKDYFRPSLVQQSPTRPHHGQSESSKSAPFFVVPRKRYHYWTPRGRRADISSGGAKAKTHGHTNAALGIRTSPYVSFWYCGGISPKTLRKFAVPKACMLCYDVPSLPPGVRDR